MAGRIFTDVSTGMRGFGLVGQRGAGFRALQRAIDVAAGEAGAGGASRCSLGAMVVCSPAEDGGPPRCTTTKPIDCPSQPRDWASSALFSAASSKLDAVLVPKDRPATYDPDHPPAPDVVDEAGLTVVVASGMLPDAAGEPSASGSADCKSGPSPQCVAAALLRRAADGYGVWLVSVQLDFDGLVSSDAPVDKRHTAEAEEHLKGLKRVPAGEQTPYAGVEFSVGSQQPTQQPSLTRFAYRGVRPLLIFVLSRDAAQGRKFVGSLASRLKSEPSVPPGRMRPDDVVHTVELAPLPAPTFRLASLEFDRRREAQAGVDPAELAEFKPGTAGVDEEGVTMDVTCGAKGRGVIAVHTGEAPGAAPLEAYIRPTAFLRGPLVDRQTAPAQLAETFEQPGGFGVRLRCGALGLAGSEPKTWAVEFGLRRGLGLDEQAANAAWWSVMSAQNSYGAPERVYGLREVVLPLLRRGVEGDAAMGRLRLNVRRIP